MAKEVWEKIILLAQKICNSLYIKTIFLNIDCLDG